MGLLSSAHTRRAPGAGGGAVATKRARRAGRSMRPSASASYTLGQRCWKHGACDNATNEWASG